MTDRLTIPIAYHFFIFLFCVRFIVLWSSAPCYTSLANCNYVAENPGTGTESMPPHCVQWAQRSKTRAPARHAVRAARAGISHAVLAGSPLIKQLKICHVACVMVSIRVSSTVSPKWRGGGLHLKDGKAKCECLRSRKRGSVGLGFRGSSRA